MDLEELERSAGTLPVPGSSQGAVGKLKNTNSDSTLPKKVCRVANSTLNFSVNTINTFSILSSSVDEKSESAPENTQTAPASQNKEKKKSSPHCGQWRFRQHKQSWTQRPLVSTLLKSKKSRMELRSFQESWRSILALKNI
ncbi:unnamed protein product [Nezara viridula]|uniref:Uncharacterized protein n=1 Tax=Nezara viridula TaxID=85310 RepID=A0A9P0E8C4_NEZVI|nr:unnamed protein product [Nezara viridula]